MPEKVKQREGISIGLIELLPFLFIVSLCVWKGLAVHELRTNMQSVFVAEELSAGLFSGDFQIILSDIEPGAENLLITESEGVLSIGGVASLASQIVPLYCFVLCLGCFSCARIRTVKIGAMLHSLFLVMLSVAWGGMMLSDKVISEIVLWIVGLQFTVSCLAVLHGRFQRLALPKEDGLPPLMFPAVFSLFPLYAGFVSAILPVPSSALTLSQEDGTALVLYDGFFSKTETTKQFRDISSMQWRTRINRGFGTTYMWALFTSEAHSGADASFSLYPGDDVLLVLHETPRASREHMSRSDTYDALCSLIASRVGARCHPTILLEPCIACE